ncbi:MAG: VOC family protein [Saprospiraceae bacterium]|nr:VOC family protein [Saprospiraceae bacterium]MBK7788695.1 VOC family protein [Saprospiraceae bacterium]MBK8111996.1 VOC family protein [Saprospiraceae bacterium]MBK8850346.1 VOC family protein [Saprospiraceae bacterium]MBK9688750.1 VOC family protein [Saprospiraceae bacterium]
MHRISWFEIATNDIDRAQKFYESIFQIQLIDMDNPGLKMRMFPVEDMMNDISGALVYHAEFYHPSSEAGCMIYLNGNPDLQNVLDRVESNGGKIIVPKTQISPEHGYMAVFHDTEGNRIALHSVS